MKDSWLRKIPWGILAGSFAILLFFSLLGTIAAYLILDVIAGETSMHATLFGEWYQVILFVGTVIGVIGFVLSVAMCVLRKVKPSVSAGGRKEGGAK